MRRTTPAPSREPVEPIATYGDWNRFPPATGVKRLRVVAARYARSPHARRAIRSSLPESSIERFQRFSAISRRFRRAASDRTHRPASLSEPFSSPAADTSSTLNASNDANGFSTFAADASRAPYAARCAADASSFKSRSGGGAADTSTPAAGFSASPPGVCTARTRRTLSIVTARD